MRLLVFSHDGQLLGAQRMLLEYLESGTHAADEVTLVATSEGPLTKHVAAMPGHRVLIEPRPPYGEGKARAAVRRLRYVLKLARLVRKERPDAVYVNTIVQSSPVLASWLARVPCVVHVHEGRSFFGGGFERGLRIWALRKLPRRFIAVSKATAKLLQEHGFDGRRIRVVYNGVRPASLAIADQQDEFITRASGGVVVGTIGAVQPRKGVHHLVKAARLLRDRGVKAHFVVVGHHADENYVRGLQAEVDAAGLAATFRLVGRQPDIERWFHEFDIFVNAAVEEPFALVNLEAMARGLPIVAADVDGTREAVLDRETGLLVPAADPARLADAIGALVADPALRQRMGVAGRARAASRFGIADYIQGVKHVVEETISRGTP